MLKYYYDRRKNNFFFRARLMLFRFFPRVNSQPRNRRDKKNDREN